MLSTTDEARSSLRYLLQNGEGQWGSMGFLKELEAPKVKIE